MPTAGLIERFRPYSVPVSLFILVIAAASVVPPLVLGDASGRTYALTAAVLIIAVSSVMPYAVLVALLTLPLAYTGLGSYAAPAVIPTAADTLSAAGAVRHVVAGSSYVVAATAVGAMGIGIDFASNGGSSPLPTAIGLPFMVLGGGLVAGAFVGVQLWRYGGSAKALNRRSVLGTVALGMALAPSPLIAFWAFNNTV